MVFLASIALIMDIAVPGIARSVLLEIGAEDGVIGIMVDGLHAIIEEYVVLATEFAPIVFVVIVRIDVHALASAFVAIAVQ